MSEITAEEIADYRKQHGCGMMEARRMVEKKHIDEHIEQLESLVREMYAVLNTPTWDRLDRNTDGKESAKFEQRMVELGLLGGDAE